MIHNRDVDVNFGIELLGKVKSITDEDRKSVPKGHIASKDLPGIQNLGKGLGSQLVRSYLGTTSAAVSDTFGQKAGQRMAKMAWQTPRQERGRQPGVLRQTGDMMAREAAPLPKEQMAKLNTIGILDENEPNGMFLALLLNDPGPASPEELAKVSTHRWSFGCAEDMAGQSKSFCCFVRCLLELSRNVQVREEGDVLDKRLIEACKAFVSAQCREGHMGEMYQVLTHFLSNTPVFVEWERFLEPVFDDARAKEEAFLVPHLEQVWLRFTRFRQVLEDIFKVLDSKFVWQHRLPKVSVLLSEQMRRRCFSSKAVLQNELFATEKCQSDSIKKIKYEFQIT
eukprot:TRINITY_DN13932_c0_g1_i1.p1 TRINITY_DN13932_c0_g1~~TRINITY_DN13932_c0_g1_i1.p1  ORF type:complete len:339 (-),score=94.30 TRINITY_DN13932_c0_g1_i1:133-1149(-)